MTSHKLATLTLFFTADNSDCDQDEEFTNIRHYFGNRYSDGTDSGIVQVCLIDTEIFITGICLIYKFICPFSKKLRTQVNYCELPKS